jgi:hypothetical protein
MRENGKTWGNYVSEADLHLAYTTPIALTTEFTLSSAGAR